jgi:uncharacterized protein (UPF0332 family)
VPTTKEHLARARQNLRFAESFDLKTTPYLDWVVTAYFYSALHLVDALLYYRDSAHGGEHQTRSKYLREKPYLKEINHKYRELRNRCDNARYDLLTLTAIKIEKDIIPLYREIEKHILAQLPK